MLTSVRTLQTKFKDIFPGDYVYYLDTTKFVTDDHTDINIEFMLSRGRDTRHIFDLSDEPWRESLAERLNELCVRFKLENYLILSHSLKYNQNYSHPNIIYFPHNYFDPVIHWNENDSLKNINVCDRSFFVSCLNRQPRYSRIYNFLKILGRSWFDKSLITMHDLQEASVHTVANDLYVDEWIEQNLLDEWEKVRTSLPTECVNDLDIGHVAYHDAYINLVTETFVQPNELFFTEKVYKPIACGQLFLILGPTGSAATLRKMGFDMFDDIIDHSRYDWIVHWKTRTEAIHSILDDLYKLDWPAIYRDTKKRRLANARHFYSGLAVKPYMTEIADRMTGIFHQTYRYDQNYLLKLHNIRGKVFEGLPPITHLFNR